MPAKIQPPPRAELAALVAKNMGHRELAVHLRVSVSTVNHWLRRYGLHTTGYVVRRRMEFAADEIRQLVAMDLTIQQIADRIGCSIDALKPWMADHGIQTRRQIAFHANREFNQARRQARQYVTPSAQYVTPSAEARFAANPFGL